MPQPGVPVSVVTGVPQGSCPKKVPFSGSAVDPRSLIANELWGLLAPALHLNKKGLSWVPIFWGTEPFEELRKL